MFTGKPGIEPVASLQIWESAKSDLKVILQFDKTLPRSLHGLFYLWYIPINRLKTFIEAIFRKKFRFRFTYQKRWKGHGGTKLAISWVRAEIYLVATAIIIHIRMLFYKLVWKGGE